jgi:hypothetical protein
MLRSFSSASSHKTALLRTSLFHLEKAAGSVANHYNITASRIGVKGVCAQK